MARNLQELLPALFVGDGGSFMTQDQINERREMADALMQGDPAFENAGLLGAIGRGAEGFVAGRDRRIANRAEGENREYDSSLLASLLGGGGSSAALSPSTASSSPLTAPVEPVSSVPLDNPTSRIMDATGDPSVEWLKYNNQGATRNQPLSEDLVGAMGFLPEMGVTMEVFSGGQPSEGPNRVGSHRHDHGGAGDVFFYKDGRKLDWSNPDDLPVFEEIVRRGKASGVTGFGAGDGYMQPGSMHLGFGGDAVWGAGGKGENAPEWLRNAYNSPSIQSAGGAPQQQAMQQQAPQGVQTAQSGGINPELLQVLADPRASETTRGIAQLLMQQQMQQSDPMRQLDMQYKQAQLDQLRNPTPEQTAEMQNLSWRAQQAGLQPGSQEYVDFMLGGGKGPENVINVGGGDKFYENLDKAQGDTFASLSEGGINARTKLRQVERLDQLLASAPSGGVAMLKQAAGDYGINTEGLDDIQAAQALINELVPQQRPEGSGPMSDADLELFKRSLPRIINQPGGNQKIIQTIRGVTEYQIQLGNIADAVANREMTPKEAREAMRQLANPLEGIGGISQSGSTDDGWTTAPNGVRIRKRSQ